MPASCPLRLSPLKVTVLALATPWLLKLALAVPLRLTASTV